MPHYKCTQCHHEWDAIPRHPGLVELCDWCGAPSFILENKTPLEKMVVYVEKNGWDKLLKGDDK